ncbi:MAG TPA: 4-(cytidine 5'-diphospho)-2-C-methyl-D-erythritol kinase [Chloroflexota bacterium]|nr:4-(cytidine 5'-diphospho)-2-C-methyl-D-erythritol kinase [Chloroflexota bacterium]
MTERLYRCYAKVNLSLEVLGRRSDGFHDLASVVHTIGLADDLRLDLADALISRVEGLDIEPTANLVARAATLLRDASRSSRGAELTLLKRIPAAAGLGGGSSDAAATLLGLNALWDTRLGLTELKELATQLGSDVPFFLRGGAAMMRGRGEELEALPPLRAHWLVLIVPPHDLADKTQRVYGALVPEDFSDGAVSERLATRLRNTRSDGWQLADDELVNGFARAANAVFPRLAETHAAAQRVCGRRFHLSGAGPALFALAADRTDARLQAARLAAAGLVAQAVRTVKHARVSVRRAATAQG